MTAMTTEQLAPALARIAAAEATIQKTLMNRLLQKIGPTRPFVAVYRRLGPMIDP